MNEGNTLERLYSHLVQQVGVAVSMHLLSHECDVTVELLNKGHSLTIQHKAIDVLLTPMGSQAMSAFNLGGHDQPLLHQACRAFQ